MARKKPVGWRGEPVRHGQAARGIKTAKPKPNRARSRFPVPKDPSLVGQIPGFMHSGGGHLWSEVLEYRVWFDPPTGSDYFKAYETFEEAQEVARRAKDVQEVDTFGTRGEEVIVVVLQKPGEWVSWRDDEISVGQEERVTEWFPSWLEDTKYSPANLKRKLAEAKEALAEQQETKRHIDELVRRYGD